MRNLLLLLTAAALTQSGWTKPIPAPPKKVTQAPKVVDKRAAVEEQYRADLQSAGDSDARAAAVTRWWKGLTDAGLSQQELMPLWKSKMDELAQIDFYAVFQCVLDVPTADPKEPLRLFPPEQQEALKKLGDYKVAQYYDKSTVYPTGIPLPGRAFGDRSRPVSPVSPAQAAENKRRAAYVKNVVVAGYQVGGACKLHGMYAHLKNYDVDRDTYEIEVLPQQGGALKSGPHTIKGSEFRGSCSGLPNQKVVLCSCDRGYIHTTYETTATWDLPQGYFSGIEVRKSATRTHTETTQCGQCKGQGWTLQKF